MIFWMKNQGVKREKRIIIISIIIIIIILQTQHKRWQCFLRR